MTAPARFKQSDVTRFTKGVMAAGVENARIIMDLASGKIEAIIGDNDDRATLGGDGWDDDDEE